MFIKIQSNFIFKNLIAYAQNVLLIFFMLNINSMSYGQPSISATDARDVIIKYNGQNESFTVIRDGKNKARWYYVPRKIVFCESIIDGILRPDFQLLQNHIKNPEKNIEVSNKGIAQFSIVISQDQSELNVLKDTLINYLKKFEKDQTGFTLDPLPVKSQEVTIFAFDDKKAVYKFKVYKFDPLTNPTKIPITISLKESEVNFIAIMLKDSTLISTGIPISMELTFGGYDNINNKITDRKVVISDFLNFNKYSSKIRKEVFVNNGNFK